MQLRAEVNSMPEQVPCFPFGMEHRLVRLRLDFAEPVHASHVVHAVHCIASSGRFGKPVPIIESARRERALLYLGLSRASRKR